MSGFVLSPAARRDIEAIWDFTVEGWGVAQAERYLRAIQTACEDLGQGKRVGESAERVRAGYRRLAVGSHVLFFRRSLNGGIDIVRILHRRMDVARHL